MKIPIGKLVKVCDYPQVFVSKTSEKPQEPYWSSVAK